MSKQKPRAAGQWTESRYFSFIRSNLRKAWMKYPVRHKALEAVAMPNDGRYDNRTKKMYPCAVCKQIFKSSEVQVDHITPCGSLKSYEDLPRFVETLFCELDNLRVVCKTCHNKITQEERNARKQS